MSVNRVTIVGNLGTDPDIRAFDEGAICTFSVATNEFYSSGNERRQHTEWHTVVTFGKLAQNCSRYLKKGSKVLLEGRLRSSTYQDKEGRNHHRTKIHSSNVQFLDALPQEAAPMLMLEAHRLEESDEEAIKEEMMELA